MNHNKKSFYERLSILTNSERELIYGLPKFNNLERKYFFDLEKIEEDIVFKKLNGINSKIYFILQLGYFKFSNKFFKFGFYEVLEDIQYILAQYFPVDSQQKKIMRFYSKRLNPLYLLMQTPNISLKK